MATQPNPAVERWPNLDGLGLHPELVTSVRFLFNGIKDHTQAFSSLNTKTNSAASQAAKATSQSKAVASPSAAGLSWFTGSGSPNGVVTASPGSLYTSTAGGANVTLWVKESGVNTNTGWVSK